MTISSNPRIALHAPSSETTSARNIRRWAVVRLILGFLQMFGAVFSVTLLVRAGVTTPALIAVALTGVLTTVSVLLFGANALNGKSHEEIYTLGGTPCRGSALLQLKEQPRTRFWPRGGNTREKDDPSEAEVIAHSGPVRSNWSVSASWEIQTTLGKTEYSKWVISQLQPEFKVVRANEAQLTFTKHEDSDAHVVECQFVPTKEKLHVRVTFSAHPD